MVDEVNTSDFSVKTSHENHFEKLFNIYYIKIIFCKVLSYFTSNCNTSMSLKRAEQKFKA